MHSRGLGLTSRPAVKCRELEPLSLPDQRHVHVPSMPFVQNTSLANAQTAERTPRTTVVQQQGTPPGSAMRAGSFFQRLSPLMGKKDGTAPQKVGNLGRPLLPAAATCMQRMLNMIGLEAARDVRRRPSISGTHTEGPHTRVSITMSSLRLHLIYREGVHPMACDHRWTVMHRSPLTRGRWSRAPGMVLRSCRQRAGAGGRA